MTNSDYATQNLLESLFGRSSYSFKNLDGEEKKALRALGYEVIDWDLALSEGKLTKEDVNKRVALYKQLLAMDEEIKNRKPKKEPKFKWGDRLKTTYGDIIINYVNVSNNVVEYHYSTESGGLGKIKEEDLLKRIVK